MAFQEVILLPSLDVSVFRLNPEEGKRGNFRYDLNYNQNKNNIEENTDIITRPRPEIWRVSFSAQYGLG